MNNQETVPITTVNSNTLVTPLLPLTSFETRLNAMENSILNLGSTLGQMISANNPSGKSRRESDQGYPTRFSINASQSVRSSESNLISPLMMIITVAYLLKRNPAVILLIFTEHQRIY